ncbi:acyl-CoA dehydrogenase [Candidatus Phycosocius bacilliformis]|uniref:Acyl-CoA dehydrogenase n=1 Tax=Candidatus Phycosocius bacilliformis TaxID=1445552 RepID=A0A2P2EB79_9PROT|nr:acyl-CoA dehydrogenase family protein [Candidatus Phycosocius bacilliformis]GBF58311.1 acyl-CoA dehydrogenase [Candidatus Phycosocius bacilliformis]
MGTSFAAEPDHVVALRQQLRRFVDTKAPREKRQLWDRTHTWPRDLFAELADMGICGLTVDEAYGGVGQDIYAAVAVIEELCRAGAFLAGPFIHCAFYGGMNISENGNEAQKAAYLPALAKGELMFCYGLSEPDVGGDLSSVTTRGVIEGDHVVINGAKRWCTGADFADYIYCLIRTESDEKRKNLAFVLIPKDTPGVTLQPIEHVNLRYTLSSDVYFDNARIPVSHIVGGPEKWGKGWGMLAGRALDVEKLEITAVTFGIAQAAVEEAWAYAQERVQFGKVISGHQAIRHALVEARTKLEACRHMLYHAAWLATQNLPCGIESSMAKLFVADTAAEIALICQRVLGAYALSDAFDMERHVRDLLGMRIVGGSSDMQKNNLAGLWGMKG